MRAGTIKGPGQTLQAEKLNGFWQRKQIKSPICVQIHPSHKKKKVNSQDKNTSLQ